MSRDFSKIGHFLLFALVFLALFLDPRALGIDSRNLVGFLRALLVLALLVYYRKAAWSRFQVWRHSPPEPFPRLSTAGLGVATLKALPIYLFLTALILAPMLPYFFTHFYADGGDGMQMVWNVWWFKTALFSGASPFYTDYLHFPLGSTLWGASYHPLKSLLVAPLIPVMGLLPSYNLLFVATLIGCSLSAFALSFVVSRSFLGALAAGFVFGFWNNRFAHLNGHLHTVSTELVPLFVLCLLLWFHEPSLRRSLCLSALLFGSLFLDHYGFLFNVFLFAATLAWAAFRQRGIAFLFRAPYLPPALFFLLVTLATSGALVAYILGLSRMDPWGGAHGAVDNSMDLFAPWIPGAYSWMRDWTVGFWSHLPSGEIEGSIYPGLTVVAFSFLAYRKLKSSPIVCLFTGLTLFFAILALGPHLQFWGQTSPLSLPYHFFHKTLPFLRMSGVPVRFAQVAVLCCAVLVAIFLSTFENRKALIAATLCLLFIDLLPRLPAMTAPQVPKYVEFLRDIPEKPAIIDAYAPMTTSLYYQTVHEKPLAFGYLARVPESRRQAETRLRQAIALHDWSKLREAGFSYVVLPTNTPARLPQAFQDDKAIVYTLR